MKKVLFLICLASVACGAKTADNSQRAIEESPAIKGVDIKYKGFYAPFNSANFNQLLFTIQNNTTAMVYLSLNDIKIQVLKNSTILKQDTLRKVGNAALPDFLEDIIFTTDSTHPKTCEEKEMRNKVIASLKKAFAEKLYRKNAVSKNNRKYFIPAVISDCLVLFPKEKINFSDLFVSKSLDSNCIVTAEYIKSDYFTTYNDENGKDIKIKY